ncbi:Zn(2)-C6 fungal-type DNA-binding domain protein [Kalmanozyma brasiliensis GHG001]|uniref:Zn(2)-C6 fungal-type DNA-binding domain protein n=1 Tax=Kalmanozyma brasiliensis (strain GHG001) TaxID=1365824 RepID=UPI001CE7AF37|nr:Zn(2)-C6 fungal-type DNA-binding domain protein [Kalmanozyma brasiliensis GHG001]EST08402.2 Zn(2)-C6 fungal-type DNA-binding domain protein [Kalmanozyma brasiliensis GHG001]
MPLNNLEGVTIPQAGPSQHSGTNGNGSSSSASSSTVHASIGHDNSFDSSDNGKRNRYQYSCLQCQRRKQRCSRTYPCEKCMQRGIAHLCSPPSNLHRPSRRIRMRQKLAAAAEGDQPVSKKARHESLDDMDDMDTYELDDEHNIGSSHPQDGAGSGNFLQQDQSFHGPGSADASTSMLAPHTKTYGQPGTAPYSDHDARNRHYDYMQHQPQQEPSQRHQDPVPYQHRRYAPYQVSSEIVPFASTPAFQRSTTTGRASLSSPTQMLPPSFSPSDLHTSSIQEPARLRRSSTTRNTQTRSSDAANTGADALAQLATVAQWPALQHNHRQADPSNDPNVKASTSFNTGTSSNASPQRSVIGGMQNAPSSSRSQGLDSDQRSMVDADDAFIGKPALNGLGWNPFRRHDSAGTDVDLLSWTGQLGRGFGLVIPKYELRSVQQSLPSKSQAQRLLQIYLDDFNWSRFPTSAAELVKAIDVCIDRSSVSDDVQMLPLMAFCLSIFGLATLDLAVRPYPTRSSRTYFFAARKALSLSESLGLHTLDSLSASLNLCRYLDLCRVPRSTWLQVASCMRGAIDLGLHLDGAHLGQNCSNTLQRRVLWSHIVHQDREWSVLFGRPMTEIPFSTTPVPTLEDYLNVGLELTCAQYLVVRDSFRIHIERISRLFQEIAASSNSSPSARIYERALEIDADIVAFTESLPPCLSTAQLLSGGAMRHQDFSTIFYHHLCTNQILFFRSLLHRPFWMESSDLISAEDFKRSRQICVDLALSDLRGRRLLSRRIPVTMLCHLYGSAYSLLSMNTIIASDMLFALDLDERLQAEEVQEKLGYIQEYVAAVRSNIQESRGDHLAVKELYVMRSLLKRIQDKVATLNPQSVGFQVLGVRYPGSCADRLAMTLTELQSAANLLLNMARAGVRVDDATRIPHSGEDRLSTSSRSGTSSAPSSASARGGAGAGGQAQAGTYVGEGAEFGLNQEGGAGMDTVGMLNAGNGNAVTPSADSLDLFLSNADEWLSSLLNPGAAAFSAPAQPLDFGFSLF